MSRHIQQLNDWGKGLREWRAIDIFKILRFHREQDKTVIAISSHIFIIK